MELDTAGEAGLGGFRKVLPLDRKPRPGYLFDRTHDEERTIIAESPEQVEAPEPSSSPVRQVLKVLQSVMLLVVPAAIYVVLFRRMGVDEVLRQVGQARPGPLLLAVTASLLAAVVMNSFVWQQILAAMGHRLSFGRAVFAENASLPLRMLLPAKSGEIFKAMYVKAVAVAGLSQGLGSVMFHKVINIIALLLLALPTVATTEVSRPRVLLILLALALSLWLYFRPGMFQWLTEHTSRPLPERIRNALGKVVGALGNTPIGTKLRLLGLAIVFQSAHLVSVAMILRSLGESVPFWQLCAYVPVVVLVGILPIAIYGLGTREAVFVVLFSSLIGKPSALAAALLFTAIQFLLPVLVGATMTWPFVTIVLKRAEPNEP